MSLTHSSVLVSLVQSIDTLFPAASPSISSRPAQKRKRGRSKFYPDALFYKALVIMIVRRLTTASELFAVLQEPTPEMQCLRSLLCQNGRFPCRRTWTRRLNTLPDTLPDQIGVLGRFLVERLQPFAHSGRAVALDSTLLRAHCGRVWHKKDREAGRVPHSGIDTQAGWTKSGHHGWVYGWKLHLAACCGDIWIPLAAKLTPANCHDGEVAPALLEQVPASVVFVLGDTHLQRARSSRAVRVAQTDSGGVWARALPASR